MMMYDRLIDIFFAEIVLKSCLNTYSKAYNPAQFFMQLFSIFIFSN